MSLRVGGDKRHEWLCQHMDQDARTHLCRLAQRLTMVVQSGSYTAACRTHWFKIQQFPFLGAVVTMSTAGVQFLPDSSPSIG